MVQNYENDENEIRRLINAMFDAVCWSTEKAPDWSAFVSTFADGAVLVPAARPAKLKRVLDFAASMSDQRESGALAELSEIAISHDIKVFANIAVALAVFCISVNGGAETKGVNAFLFVKDDGKWRVAGTAWDNESEQYPVSSPAV